MKPAARGQKRSRYLLPVLIACAAAVQAQEAPDRSVSTLADQEEVAVTAYNNGIGLVKDRRKLQLGTGELLLEFRDVAEKIQPATVSLRSLNAEGSIVIHEQNYEYDLISPEKLMEKYIGREVRLVNFSEEIGFTEVSAILLSTNNGAVYQIGEEIHLSHPGTVVLPRLPENLIAKPTLKWELQNDAAEQQVEVTYITGGLSWQADYVVTVPQEEQTLDLNGWVTLSNQSGATYENAELKLVAGAVNMAPPPAAQDYNIDFDTVLFGMKALPQQEAFAEFHLYTMPRRTTLKQNQSKQLALLSAEGIAFEKKYQFKAEPHWFLQSMPAERDKHVAAFIEFQNEEANQLGIPLPAGVMRIYQEDSSGTLQFAGEDRIEHTPKDEKVRLRMGEAFDVMADRIQTEFDVIASNVHESAYEITLRNHKAVDILVEVEEHLPGDWRVLEESMEHEKKDAQTIVYQVPVPADGEARVTYRVQVRM